STPAQCGPSTLNAGFCQRALDISQIVTILVLISAGKIGLLIDRKSIDARNPDLPETDTLYITLTD
ncbi:MAG: hypothetical protein WD600_11455, partial [Pseudohongiella sp.]